MAKRTETVNVAIVGGGVAGLTAAALLAKSGQTVAVLHAALNPVTGRDKVARLMLGLMSKGGGVFDVAIRSINGLPAFVVKAPQRDGFAPRFVFRVDLDAEGRIAELHTILASSKLRALMF